LTTKLHGNKIIRKKVVIFSYFVEFPSSTDTCLRQLHQAPLTDQLVCVFQYNLSH